MRLYHYCLIKTLFKLAAHVIIKLRTGYCIRFKTLKDININVLEEAIRFGIEQTKQE